MRVGVTASRKAVEQITMLRRRGADVLWAPMLQVASAHGIDDHLRRVTDEVLAEPVDILVATTGVGMQAWLEASAAWGLQAALLEHLDGAEIIARGPKTVGAGRVDGLGELWSPTSECFGDVLAHLAGRDLTGLRIVVQELGRSLSAVARRLERRGARVRVVTVHRIEPAAHTGGVLELVQAVARRDVDAVTFTAAPAVSAFMDAAQAHGIGELVADAMRAQVVAVSVGPVTAAELELRHIPTIWPERSRLGSMVALVERELPERRAGVAIDVAGGHLLRMHGERVLLDGQEVRLTPAPAAVLRALAARPGHVVSRPDLLAALPSGTAGTEHAVEMAVARLRQAVGSRVVQTAVKRGYRLATG